MQQIMQTYQIRLAKFDDASLLTALGEETFIETYQNKTMPEDVKANMYLYVSQTFTENIIASHLKNENITYLIAMEENLTLGYTKLVRYHSPEQYEDKKVIQLEKIYVRKSAQGKQIGKALMDKSLEIAKNENFDLMWLCVWEVNLQAVNFYKKQGFEHVGLYPFQMGEQIDMDWLLVKQL